MQSTGLSFAVYLTIAYTSSCTTSEPLAIISSACFVSVYKLAVVAS